jgi:hypothetical protein
MDAVSQYRYRLAGASGWLAVAADRLLLVVHPQAVDAGLAFFAAGRAEGGGGFQAALDELTKGGLSATPEFALLDWSGSGVDASMRVSVRGGVQVAVEAAGTTHTLDGSGVSTWTEQSFPQATRFDVVVVAADESPEGWWLPIERGTALVARISAEISDAGVTAAPTTAVSAAVAAPAAEPAPQLYLDLSTGSREQLGQPILVGRAPTATTVSGGSLPRLVSIPGDKDISRTHAQFVVEGGTVVVTDLHSRNGTQVIMPGKAPQQLRQGEPTEVIVGTIVDLGGGVTLTVREES